MAGRSSPFSANSCRASSRSGSFRSTIRCIRRCLGCSGRRRSLFSRSSSGAPRTLGGSWHSARHRLLLRALRPLAQCGQRPLSARAGQPVHAGAGRAVPLGADPVAVRAAILATAGGRRCAAHGHARARDADLHGAEARRAAAARGRAPRHQAHLHLQDRGQPPSGHHRRSRRRRVRPDHVVLLSAPDGVRDPARNREEGNRARGRRRRQGAHDPGGRARETRPRHAEIPVARGQAHTFHGAAPPTHSASSARLSRSVSTGCQKPRWR